MRTFQFTTLLPLVMNSLLWFELDMAWCRAETTQRADATRARRVLYNMDGDSCMTLTDQSHKPGPITTHDLERRIDELTQPGSQVDTVLVCINAQVMYYPTRIGTMRGGNSTEEEKAHWPAGERQRYANIQNFFQQEIDPYAVLLATAKARGREAMLTFRMNDAHGNDFLRTQFWADHPEFRLKNGGLDFRQADVREYVFRLIEESVERYECDGIELDFQRFPTFFQDGSIEERVACTNELVQRVRTLLDRIGKQRGRHLLLAARVPSNYGRTAPSYESSLEIGCDPVAWAQHEWIDFLTVSEFLFVRFDLAIRPWKERIANIPIYGGIECATGPGRDKCLTAEQYCKAAQHLKQDGADGIYLFNFFTTREHGPEAFEPPFEVLSKLANGCR